MARSSGAPSLGPYPTASATATAASSRRLVRSPPRSATRAGSRATNAPNEVRAKPPARLEIAPRPPGAPPPARAPPRGGGGAGGGRAGRGDLLRDRLALPGAHGRRAHARSAAPAATLAARSEGAAAGRGPAATGGGAGLAGTALVSRIPERWTLGCCLAPLRSQRECPSGATEHHTTTSEKNKEPPGRPWRRLSESGTQDPPLRCTGIEEGLIPRKIWAGPWTSLKWNSVRPCHLSAPILKFLELKILLKVPVTHVLP